MSTTERQERLEFVIAAFLEAVDAGERVTPQEWIERYPDLRVGLAEFFADQVAFDRTFESVSRPLNDTDGGTRNLTSVDGEHATDGSPGLLLRNQLPDDYELIREIGRGGMGVVYEARQRSLDRPVALKMLRTDAFVGTEDLQRIQREAEIAACIDHPGIIPLYEVGRDVEQPYLAMKLVRGGNLSERLDDYHADPAAAARLVLSIARAVEHAHQRGVLHRDLKPANVLIDDHGQPQITDFGLARQLDSDSDLTRTGVVLGTPAYMAPEQAGTDASRITTATDVYGIGAILYTLLAGQPPFRGTSVLGTLDQVRWQAPASAVVHNPRVPGDLNVICLKCLEKDPDCRYPSAGALADDLNRFLDCKPISARPTPLIERFRLWQRRNPVVASLSAVVCVLVLTLFAGTTVASVLLIQANRQTLDSLEQEIRAKDKATKSEEMALSALYEARVAQARAGRFSGRVGQRLESLDAIKKAAELIPRLNLDASERLRLRNEAIACMSLFDLQDDRQWTLDDTANCVDADASRYAYWDSESRTIRIRDMQTSALLQQLEVIDGYDVLRYMQFSFDGKYIAAWCKGSARSAIQIWRSDHPQSILNTAMDHSYADHNYTGISRFSADSKQLALLRRDHVVEIVDLASCTPVIHLPGSGNLRKIRFDPTSRRVAVHRSGKVEIVDLTTREVQRTIELPESVHLYRLDWSPDGRMLAAAASNRKAYVWEADTGELVQTLVGHAKEVTTVSFHPSANLLRTSGYDGITRFWSLPGGEQLLRLNERLADFSNDGSWIRRDAGRLRVAVPSEHRVLFQQRAAGAQQRAPNQFATHPAGRLLVVGTYDQLMFWDLATLKLVAGKKLPGSRCRFNAAGTQLFTLSEGGQVSAYRVRRRETDADIIYEVLPRRNLTPSKNSTSKPMPIDASPSERRADFRFVPMHVDRRRNVVRLLNTQTSELRQQRVNHNSLWDCDMTRDGQLFATSTFHGRDVKIWDGASGKLVRTIRAGNAKTEFSPDGQMLAVAETGRCALYDVKSGRLLHQTAPEPTGDLTGVVSFSTDGSMVAFRGSQQFAIKLLRTDTFEELATFEIPDDQMVSTIYFTPDDGHFVVSPNRPMRLYIWDLRKVRAGLNSLDWDAPAIPEPEYDGTKSLHVEFLSGDAVKIEPQGGNFQEPTEVSLDTHYQDAALHYTLDGSPPARSTPARNAHHSRGVAASSNRPKAPRLGLDPRETELTADEATRRGESHRLHEP